MGEQSQRTQTRRDRIASIVSEEKVVFVFLSNEKFLWDDFYNTYLQRETLKLVYQEIKVSIYMRMRISNRRKTLGEIFLVLLSL